MPPKLVTLPRTVEPVPEPDWTQHFTDEVDQHHAQEIWHAVIAEMREAGTLSSCNGLIIKRYVLCCVMHDREYSCIEQEGTILTAAQKPGSKRGKVQRYNPHWSILRDLNNMCSAHEAALGLSPKGRGQAAPANSKRTQKLTAADKILGVK